MEPSDRNAYHSQQVLLSSPRRHCGKKNSPVKEEGEHAFALGFHVRVKLDSSQRRASRMISDAYSIRRDDATKRFFSLLFPPAALSALPPCPISLLFPFPARLGSSFPSRRGVTDLLVKRPLVLSPSLFHFYFSRYSLPGSYSSFFRHCGYITE